MQVYIYALVDPTDGQPRYVGKTTGTLAKRRADHIHRSKSGRNHKNCWLRKLAKQGLKPEIVLLEVTTEEEWEGREKFWIADYRSKYNLTNVADGGGTNIHTYGEESPKSKHSKEYVREAVTLFTLGFPRDVIRSFEKFKNLSDKTLRSWCQKETRSFETSDIPTRSQYLLEIQ